jgi:alpha-beta hydrolase superfamily lysophospholipase
MNADAAAIEPASGPSAAADEPVYLPAGNERLFGWIHAPAGERSCDVGVVICQPFGYEALCAHRSLRAFAQMAAAVGVPALNFDYLGTGDSVDLEPAANQLEVWCQDIVAAVVELRRRTGVRRVCLLGFRLGALLAQLAASRTPVDALILVAPITSGREHLRELRTTESMKARLEPSTSASAGPSGKTAQEGSLEVGGYCLSGATVASLERLDLASLPPPAVRDLLVIDRRGLPAARAWTESLSGLGLRAEYDTRAGLVEMIMTPPPFTRIPEEIIARVREWLQRLVASATARASAALSTAHSLPLRNTCLRLPTDGLPAEHPLIERPVRFGADSMLFGIVTERPGAEGRRAAVVLLNAGADHHVCIGRLYVTLARRWARCGYIVLRMDLAGLGNSGTRPGRPDNEVYPPAAIDDVRAAIAFLRSDYGVEDITLGGLCSGAYHTLKAAMEAVPLNHVLVVNPQLFFWNSNARIEDIQLAEVISARSVYGARLRSFAYWRKLLAGQVNVGYIARVYWRRFLLSLATRVRALARALHIPMTNDLARELREIVARGVQVSLIFARGEPGLELLRIQAGSSVQSLGDRCRLHLIDDADHTFSRPASQSALAEVLSETLSGRRAAAATDQTSLHEAGKSTPASRSCVSAPLYFPADDRKLFGWLYRHSGEQTSDLGLVICQPFGYEAICAHRSMRAAAETAAAAGFPVLRFDYTGTGDSADLDTGADQVDVWVRDIASAVDTLRRCTGVRRVCLIGFRLGALLATLAAARDVGADGLVLVAPVIDGRRYLRELRTTALASAGALNAGDKPPARDGALEAGGFLLSAASAARLAQADLMTLTHAPARALLIMDRDDLPTARAWSEKLVALGAASRYVTLPGFVKMIMTPPQFAVVPQRMLEILRSWLGERASCSDGCSAELPDRFPEEFEVAAGVELSCNAGTNAAMLREQPVVLERDPMLFGIVTHPARDERRRRAVILVNSGADYHIGAGRMYVAMARRWAARGYHVLRMDLAGIGDSGTRPGRTDDEVFPPRAIDDIAAAIDFVRKHYAVREVVLAGLCSAGYHVLRAAVAGLQVDRILMVNPQSFSWTEATAVGAVQLADVVRELGGDRRRTLSLATLKRLVSGKVDVLTVGRIYLQRARIATESGVREAARRLRIRLPRDLGWELQEIAARGVRVVFVFAAGDPGIELLRIQSGSAVKRLGDRCHVHIIESADHTFTRIAPRARMEQALSDELFAPPECS